MEKNLTVKKSNYLIETPCKLSVIEQKIVYTMLAKLRIEGNKPSYSFKSKDFIASLGLEGESGYSELKKKCRLLRARTMTIKYEPWIIESFLEECKKRQDFHENELREIAKLLRTNEVLTGWVSEILYQDGEITLYLSTLVKPFLFYLSRYYTEMDYNNLIQLKSIYSTQLYEMLKQYQNINGKNKSWERTFKIEELREKLGVTKYKLYGDFKRRVINSSIDEINSKTDIKISEIKETKNTNKVAAIKFVIQPKSQSTLSSLEETSQISIIDTEIKRIFDLFKIKYNGTLKEKFIRQMIESKGSEYVFERIQEFFIFLKTYKKKVVKKEGLFFKFVMDEIPVDAIDLDEYEDEEDMVSPAIRITEQLGFE